MKLPDTIRVAPLWWCVFGMMISALFAATQHNVIDEFYRAITIAAVLTLLAGAYNYWRRD